MTTIDQLTVGDPIEGECGVCHDFAILTVTTDGDVECGSCGCTAAAPATFTVPDIELEPVADFGDVGHELTSRERSAVADLLRIAAQHAETWARNIEAGYPLTGAVADLEGVAAIVVACSTTIELADGDDQADLIGAAVDGISSVASDVADEIMDPELPAGDAVSEAVVAAF